MESKSKEQAAFERQAQATKKQIYQSTIFQVYHEDIQYPNNKTISRDFVTHKEAVVIVPVTPDGSIVFVKQYRRAIDQILLELPAGIIDENEEPLQAAIRELEEETGYHTQNITYLGGCYTSPGFCNEHLHLYLACNLLNGKINPDEDEAIDVIHLTKNEVKDKISNQSFCDAKTLAALLYYFQGNPQESL